MTANPDPRLPFSLQSGPTNPIWGKHRGKVVNNRDPKGQGRLQVSCDFLPGLEISWAMPCVPYAGPQEGFYAVPPIGASVWVEFEGGLPSKPIWAGCFWEPEQVLLAVEEDPLLSPMKKIWKTANLLLELDDTPADGGFTLEVGPESVEIPVTIKGDATGLTITVPEAKITITPEAMTFTLLPSEVVLSPEQNRITLGEPTVEMTEAAIVATLEPATVSIAPEAVTVSLEPSNLAVTPEAIECLSADGSVTIAGEAVAIVCAEAEATVSPEVVSLEIGSSNVTLAPVGTVINDGALEVL